METEMQLESQHQLIQQLEAQIRDVEHMRLAESFEQVGQCFRFQCLFYTRPVVPQVFDSVAVLMLFMSISLDFFTQGSIHE